MIKGLDLSFAEPPAYWWRVRRAGGYEAMVQDAWTGRVSPAATERNLRRAREAGIATNAYTVTNLSSGVTTVERAKAACGAEWEHIVVCAIDVEVTGIAAATMIQHVKEALAHARALGKRTCVYTARWFWMAHMGNTGVFRNEPLWNAFYDSDPDIDFPSAPYGGWGLSKVVGEQFQGTTDLAGHKVDLNTFKESFWLADKRREGDVAYIKTPNGSRYLTDGVHINLIAAGPTDADARKVFGEPVAVSQAFVDDLVKSEAQGGSSKAIAEIRDSLRGGDLAGLWWKTKASPAIWFVTYSDGGFVRHHARNTESYLGAGGNRRVIEVTPAQLKAVPEGLPLPDLKVAT